MDRLLTKKEILKAILPVPQKDAYQSDIRIAQAQDKKTAKWILDRVPTQIAYLVVEMEEEFDEP